MEDLKKIFIYEDEDEVTITAPYNIVTYVDDNGHKHIAVIKDEGYLAYILDRFVILENKKIEK